MVGGALILTLSLTAAPASAIPSSCASADDTPKRAECPDGSFAMHTDRLGLPKREEVTLSPLPGQVSSIQVRPAIDAATGVTFVADKQARRGLFMAPPTSDPLTGRVRPGPELAELRWDRGTLRFAWSTADRTRYEVSLKVILSALEVGEIVCQHEGKDVLIIGAPPVERIIDPTKGRQRLGLPRGLPALAIDPGEVPSPWVVDPSTTGLELVLTGSGPALTVFLGEGSVDVFFASSAKERVAKAKDELDAIKSLPPPAAPEALRIHDGELARLQSVLDAAEAEYRTTGDPKIATPITVTIRDATGGRPRAILHIQEKSR